jgi:hypothetical protein
MTKLKKHLYIKLFTLSILMVGFISLPLYFLNPTVHGLSIQDKERTLRHRRFAVEPIKILHVKKLMRSIALGSKFRDTDDWLKGLNILIKNTSDKPISFIGLELHFIKPGASEDEPIFAYQLSYNTPASTQGQIPPKGIAEIKLSDAEYDELTQMLNENDYPLGATEVEIIVDEVRFSDGSLWRSGQIQQQSSEKKK